MKTELYMWQLAKSIQDAKENHWTHFISLKEFWVLT